MIERPRLFPSLIVGGAFAVLVGLGVWQLQRLAWKEALIAERQAQSALPPVALDDALAAGDQLDYRKVRVAGRFLHERELYLDGRTHKGQVGIHVLTPLQLADGRALLVDRGWAPKAARDPATRTEGQVAGEVVLEGALRRGGWGGLELFRPANQPAENVWVWVEPAGHGGGSGPGAPGARGLSGRRPGAGTRWPAGRTDHRGRPAEQPPGLRAHLVRAGRGACHHLSACPCSTQALARSRPHDRLSVLGEPVQRINALREAAGMLHWDMATLMPNGGAEARSEQLTALEVTSHELLTDPAMAGLFADAEGDGAGLGPWQAANLREMRRDWRHATALEADLVAALTRAGNRCEMTWREARPAARLRRRPAGLQGTDRPGA